MKAPRISVSRLSGKHLAARDGLPRLEAFEGCARDAQPGLDAVRDHQQRVVGEQARELLVVGLQLRVGLFDGGAGVLGVLELEDHQGQPIDEHDHVRPPLDRPLHHRELVDRQKCVAFRLGEIDDLQVLGPDAAQPVGQLDLHALGDQAVHAQVGQHPHAHGLRQLPDGLGERLGTRAGIEAFQGTAQWPCQHHVLEGGTLGVRHIWRDVRAEGSLEAKLSQPVQGGQLNRFFVIRGRHWL